MPRARPKHAGTEEIIGDIIIAAWFEALPDQVGDPIANLDPDELSAAFSRVLDTPARAVIDDPPDLVHIPVPPPPARSKDELITYLHDHHSTAGRPFTKDLAVALLFGCR